eukprot:3412407-Amphidinium_carterae.1
MEELMHRDESATVQERLERDLLKRQVTAGPRKAPVAVEPESKRTARTGGASSSAGPAATEAAGSVPPGATGSEASRASATAAPHAAE